MRPHALADALPSGTLAPPGPPAFRTSAPRALPRPAAAALFVIALFAAPGADTMHAQSFTGSGQHVTNFFEWPASLAVVDLAHFGEGEFRVRLIDARGRPVQVLADTRGAGELRRAVRIPAGGTFLFDIEATGAWEIRVHEGAFREAELVELGRADGQRAARRAGGARWVGFGLAGGLLLGPIGGGGVFALAGSRPAGDPPPLPADAASLGAPYREAYGSAFRESAASERRTAALVGALVGTAANAMLILNFTRGRQGEDDDDGPTTPEFGRVPLPLLRFTVPWPGRT